MEQHQCANKCEFSDLCDSLMKDILIVNLKDLVLSECLLREPDLTLRKAIQAGQTAKETKNWAKELTTSKTLEMDIIVHKT